MTKMIKFATTYRYRLNDGSYAAITRDHGKNVVYKYHACITTANETPKQYEDDFRTLVEAEQYLRDYEKGELK